MTYSIADGERAKCFYCEIPVWWVFNDKGKRIPVTKEGVPHDVSHTNDPPKQQKKWAAKRKRDEENILNG